MKFFKELFFNFHSYRFRKSKKKNIYLDFSEKQINDIYKTVSSQKKIILATQVGRGGGKWLVDIINHCRNVSAFGERNRTEEAIFRYNCSHNKIVNLNKILYLIKTEALTDWKNNNTSYISSPYFSHGIKILEENLKPDKFVIIVRDFYSLFYSLRNKNWYKENFSLDTSAYNKKIPDLFLNNPNHFYGRYINFGTDNKKFLVSSNQIKIAIFMNHTIQKILEEITNIDKRKIAIFNLNEADQNYEYCKNFLHKLDIQLDFGKKDFLNLKKRTASSIENKKTTIDSENLIEIEKIKDSYEYYLNKIKNFS